MGETRLTTAEERRRSWLLDLALASLPSLGLVLLWIGQPQTMGGPIREVPDQWPGLALVIAFVAAQWLAALGAVRARTSGRRALWLLACVLCVAGVVLGPGVLLILQNLASQAPPEP
jgi:hypothetical protein